MIYQPEGTNASLAPHSPQRIRESPEDDGYQHSTFRGHGNGAEEEERLIVDEEANEEADAPNRGETSSAKRCSRRPRILFFEKQHRHVVSPPTHDCNLSIFSGQPIKCDPRAARTACRAISAISILIFIGFNFLILYHVIVPRFPTRASDTFPPPWWPSDPKDIATYPTSFTRDVLPLPCHSHNDYWREYPLFSAIYYGCTGVEADVWAFDNELFVGHNIASLTRNRTFRSLYIDPLVTILDRQNAALHRDDPALPRSDRKKPLGIFDEEPDQTVVLLVDFKTFSGTTFPRVWEQLAPLRQRGYLTTWTSARGIDSRPLTVVLTGNAAYAQVVANATERDMFFDAPLNAFPDADPRDLPPPQVFEDEDASSQPIPALFDPPEPYSRNNSFYASASLYAAVGLPWLGRFTAKQLERMSEQIAGAKDAGLMSRYWETPGWPVGLRNYVWETLVKRDVGYLNVDDLEGATRGDWGKWG